MEDILYQLYAGDYDATPERDDRRTELSEHLLELYRQIHEALGLEFVERWDELNGAREEWSAYRYYRAGFRLGAQLMLEALKPA